MSKKKAQEPPVVHISAMTPVRLIADDTEHDPRRGKPDTKALQHLGKSIRKVGLLQSIAIERIEDNGQGQTYRVAAGRRRLRACRALIEKSIWPAETEIPTVIVDAQTAAKLRMMAMAENTMREAIHPVDAFEQVRDIMADGGDEQDAGEALGLTVLQVRQFEALGKIAPPILKAWREGKIAEHDAKAFTLCDDQQKQVEVYDRLKKSHQLYTYAIRAAFGAGSNDTTESFAVVGEQAYLAAGGQIRRDLFSEAVVFSDTELLTRLANEVIDAKCKELVADGWSWALPAAFVQNRWQHTDLLRDIPISEADQAELDQIEERMNAISDAKTQTEEEAKELLKLDARADEIRQQAFERACTPELKAMSGCFVSATRQGLDIDYGMASPGATLPATHAPAGATDTSNEETEEAGAAISGALLLHLTSELTRALANVVADDPTLAIQLLVAGLQSDYRSPVKISSTGLLHTLESRAGSGKPRFVDILPAQTGTAKTLAAAVGSMLDCRITIAGNHRTAETQAIIEMIGEKAYRAAALAAFDPEVYFTKASLGRLEEFVEDINAERDEADQLKIPKGKKAEKAAWAAATARDAGWLPPELRFECAKLDKPGLALVGSADDDDDEEADFEEVGDEEDEAA